MAGEQNRRDPAGEAVAIDWCRVARPQEDQYDTHVVLELARRAGYERRLPEAAPTFFNGKVAIWNDGMPFAAGTRPASAEHPNIKRSCDLVRLWPEAFVQCQQLLDRVAIFTAIGSEADQIVGSICHAGSNGFGSIASTVDNHVGFAEAIVHEMAHHKLRALGVDVESSVCLIENSPDSLFRSPIRYDALRPMTAVLHAQYSYTYIAALDIAIIEAQTEPARDRRVAEWSLAPILSKIEFGRDIIANNAELDDAGAEFVAGLFEWLDDIFERGHLILERVGVRPVPFEHPQDCLAECDGAESKVIEDEGLLEQALGCPKLWPKRRTSVEEHPIKDEMVLYSSQLNDAYALNATSRAIWELCDGEHTLVGIVRTLSERLGCADISVMRELLTDVWKTVEQLHGMELISLNGASSGSPQNDPLSQS